MQPHELPVYREKQRILDALASHQVIVVESPTGSGKTTQIPLILHEAGYSKNGVIGVTQPRRIAAVSVSDFIARQLGTSVPGLIGYKMRFEDRTNQDTRIKIMTDGILLQEMKADYALSHYSVLMVDEAHERSLNIDFVLGLLKRVLEMRPDFKVVVSSATINAEVFSEYFNQCPIVHIETSMYPVTVVYDPPPEGQGYDGLLMKTADIVARTVQERPDGDILIFLSGEKMIKDTLAMIDAGPFRKRIHPVPLYSRLGKEEQERVFDPAPKGKIKIVAATNIAETSVTIEGITTVIDSGLAKMNYYNPRTFTSSLVEGPISKASTNQRKGRAGRTRPGVCYRLYSKQDYGTRPLFSTEEIYRTDLSEVVLRMAEIGITNFESFDFISPPGRQGIIGAIDTLNYLDALNEDRTLSKIGKAMAAFPLLPRHSRILVEGIYRYPQVMEEVLIAVAFLSANSPFLLPAGEEMSARKAHHQFRDSEGDFVSYLRLFRAYQASGNRQKFCERAYLDARSMAEIANIKEQLQQIVSDMGVPILSGGSTEQYLCAISRGLIQFVCVRDGRFDYRSLTTERVQIHPGSVMYRETPRFIVAGEIVKTTRTYARSVSPLQKAWIDQIFPGLFGQLVLDEKSGKTVEREKKKRDTTWQIGIGGETFELEATKGKKKQAILPWERISPILRQHEPASLPAYQGLKGKVVWNGYELMAGLKLSTILRVIPHMNLDTNSVDNWPRGVSYHSNRPDELTEAVAEYVLHPCKRKDASRTLGFLSLQTDGSGGYWFKPIKSFHTALDQSIASLEELVDELGEEVSKDQVERLNAVYRKLTGFFEG